MRIVTNPLEFGSAHSLVDRSSARSVHAIERAFFHLAVSALLARLSRLEEHLRRWYGNTSFSQASRTVIRRNVATEEVVFLYSVASSILALRAATLDSFT